MPVLDDLNATKAAEEQIKSTKAARAALQNATMVLDEAHKKVQEAVDSGNFNLVPVDLRTTLNDWWTIVKTARTSISQNADIMAVYEWRP